MESDLTLVNDPKMERVLLVATLVVHDEIRSGPKGFPHGNRLLRTLDRPAIDPGYGVAGTQVERGIGELAREQTDDPKADEDALVKLGLGLDVLEVPTESSVEDGHQVDS